MMSRIYNYLTRDGLSKLEVLKNYYEYVKKLTKTWIYYPKIEKNNKKINCMPKVQL